MLECEIMVVLVHYIEMGINKFEKETHKLYFTQMSHSTSAEFCWIRAIFENDQWEKRQHEYICITNEEASPDDVRCEQPCHYIQSHLVTFSWLKYLWIA